jgi:hypothetical protein
MAGRKSILTFAGERDAMEVSNDRCAVRPGLVEQMFHTMGQQRGCDRHEQSVVAGAPQRLSAPARGKPARGCQDQKDFLVGAPCQSASELLGSRRRVVGDRLRDRNIRSGWPDSDRKTWTATREICRQFSYFEHDSNDHKGNYISNARTAVKGPFLPSKSATSKGSGAPASSSVRTSAAGESFEPNRNKRQRLPFELIFHLAFEALQCITTSRN